MPSQLVQHVNVQYVITQRYVCWHSAHLYIFASGAALLGVMGSMLGLIALLSVLRETSLICCCFYLKCGNNVRLLKLIRASDSLYILLGIARPKLRIMEVLNKRQTDKLVQHVHVYFLCVQGYVSELLALSKIWQAFLRTKGWAARLSGLRLDLFFVVCLLNVPETCYGT